MEIDSEINGDPDVVLSWDGLDWALESDCVFGNHDSHPFVVAVAASVSWRHDALALTPRLLKRKHAIWYVHFTYETGGIINNDHDWDAICVRGRNESWSFLRVAAIQLN